MYEKITAVVGTALTCSKHPFYNDFCFSTLTPTIVTIIDRINNEDLWKPFNLDILFKTREKDSKIRV